MKAIAEKMGWERDTSFFAGNQWLVKSSRGVHNIMSRDDALTPAGAVAVHEHFKTLDLPNYWWRDYVNAIVENDFTTAVRDAALELWEGE